MVSSSKQSLNQRAVVTDTSEAVAPSNQEDNGNDAADILSALPGWLQPGVSPTIHLYVFVFVCLMAVWKMIRLMCHVFESFLLTWSILDFVFVCVCADGQRFAYCFGVAELHFAGLCFSSGFVTALRDHVSAQRRSDRSVRHVSLFV